MRTKLEGPLAETIAGARAEAVIGACVHCGMCNAVCPTFQLTGDELDGPRGRIYLMKSALEGEAVGPESLLHLDRCLGCRACESACPSGVEYHRLLDIARPAVEAVVGRPWTDRLKRTLIRLLATHPALFRVAVTVGRLLEPMSPDVRSLLPPARSAHPPRPTTAHPGEGRNPKRPFQQRRRLSIRSLGPVLRRDERVTAARRMVLLAGCVQSAAAPHFNAAARRVFSRLGIALDESRAAGCCGAVSFHLDAADQARAFARRNIDAWTQALDAGAEAIVVTASGCAAFIADYPDLLAEDPDYAKKAHRVAAALVDPVEIVAAATPRALRAPAAPRIAVHDPCTLRHGLKLGGRVESLLASLGYEPQSVRDASLCCGSAGPYALTQPAFARSLRAAKLEALSEHAPAAIFTANIGCWMHLGAASPVPVRHWLEAVDEVT